MHPPGRWAEGPGADRGVSGFAFETPPNSAGTPISLVGVERVDATDGSSNFQLPGPGQVRPEAATYLASGSRRGAHPPTGRGSGCCRWNRSQAPVESGRAGRAGTKPAPPPKTIRAARCSAPVEAAGPASACTRCRETRVGRRGSLYQSCRDITRRRCRRGSGGRASVQGAGNEARRSGNPSRGGGAQVAPPTQGKGQVAEAASSNGLRIGSSVGGARPSAHLLQPRVGALGPGIKED